MNSIGQKSWLQIFEKIILGWKWRKMEKNGEKCRIFDTVWHVYGGPVMFVNYQMSDRKQEIGRFFHSILWIFHPIKHQWKKSPCILDCKYFSLYFSPFPLKYFLKAYHLKGCIFLLGTRQTRSGCKHDGAIFLWLLY